ncbi:hypothetical protein [Sphingobacterium ginsenosidimutans]|uniref:HTH gntR-type domain-containing protein n=1 Tax=Sphingobacterium ginsenosidimutans TaxID=687845 RepID=A0ABP7ZVT7_9SPHI
MKKNENNLVIGCNTPVYEAPVIQVQELALEYSISTGSVQPALTESWGTETQTKELDW